MSDSLIFHRGAGLTSVPKRTARCIDVATAQPTRQSSQWLSAQSVTIGESQAIPIARLSNGTPGRHCFDSQLRVSRLTSAPLFSLRVRPVIHLAAASRRGDLLHFAGPFGGCGVPFTTRTCGLALPAIGSHGPAGRKIFFAEFVAADQPQSAGGLAIARFSSDRHRASVNDMSSHSHAQAVVSVRVCGKRVGVKKFLTSSFATVQGSRAREGANLGEGGTARKIFV